MKGSSPSSYFLTWKMNEEEKVLKVVFDRVWMRIYICSGKSVEDQMRSGYQQ